MIPNICNFCNGTLEEGQSEFIAKVKEQVIVLSEIPSWVCNNCGEAYYSEKVSRDIDKVMKQVHDGKFIARPIAAGILKLSEANLD